MGKNKGKNKGNGHSKLMIAPGGGEVGGPGIIQEHVAAQAAGPEDQAIYQGIADNYAEGSGVLTKEMIENAVKMTKANPWGLPDAHEVADKCVAMGINPEILSGDKIAEFDQAGFDELVEDLPPEGDDEGGLTEEGNETVQLDKLEDGDLKTDAFPAGEETFTTSLLRITDLEGKAIVEVMNNGDVVAHQMGKFPEAAETFYNALRVHGLTLHNQIENLTMESATMAAFLEEIVNLQVLPAEFQTVAEQTVTHMLYGESTREAVREAMLKLFNRDTQPVASVQEQTISDEDGIPLSDVFTFIQTLLDKNALGTALAAEAHRLLRYQPQEVKPHAKPSIVR